MTFSTEENTRCDDGVVQSGSHAEFEENLHRENLRVMAEMFDGVYLQEYLRKCGEAR
ncbi:MAG: hypothetical protein IID18_10185 [Nitrospinae bacterium]|nr:hypothetical protein [Nitrospinota bacterium]